MHIYRPYKNVYRQLKLPADVWWGYHPDYISYNDTSVTQFLVFVQEMITLETV